MKPGLMQGLDLLSADYHYVTQTMPLFATTSQPCDEAGLNKGRLRTIVTDGGQSKPSSLIQLFTCSFSQGLYRNLSIDICAVEGKSPKFPDSPADR